MNITLGVETENASARRSAAASLRARMRCSEQAVTFFLDYEDGEMDAAEFSEVLAATEDGLRQAEPG